MNFLNKLKDYQNSKFIAEASQQVFGSFCEIMRITCWENTNNFVVMLTGNLLETTQK